MEKVLKTQSYGSWNTYQEPVRLSKFAEWRRKNPNGILEYVDWRAANK